MPSRLLLYSTALRDHVGTASGPHFGHNALIRQLRFADLPTDVNQEQAKWIRNWICLEKLAFAAETSFLKSWYFEIRIEFRPPTNNNNHMKDTPLKFLPAVDLVESMETRHVDSIV